MLNKDFQELKAIVFDVDGTLYHQPKLRRLMLTELVKYYAVRPQKLFDLKIIHDFRKQREANYHRQVANLAEEQYQWGAEASKVPVARVKSVVEQWIHDNPLQQLPLCIYDGVSELFSALPARGIARIIFSDYPARDKLRALGLEADGFICATDPEINKLKPHPHGLEVIMERWGFKPEELLFIGDRDDRDGECARRADIAYLLKVDKTHNETDNTFSSFHIILRTLLEQRRS